MSRGHNLRGSYNLQSVTSDCFIYCVQFETNSTDAPDGVVQADDDVTFDQTATGTYTITFPAGKRPAALLYCKADFLEDMPGFDIKTVSYVASTGVLTLKAYDEDNTSGVMAAADSTDKTVQVFAVFCRKSANS